MGSGDDATGKAWGGEEKPQHYSTGSSVSRRSINHATGTVERLVSLPALRSVELITLNCQGAEALAHLIASTLVAGVVKALSQKGFNPLTRLAGIIRHPLRYAEVFREK